MRQLLLILLLCLPLFAKAQQPLNDDYFLFESSDAVKMNAMIQDRIGYMWLGTDIGLYRFNGQGDLTAIYDTVHSAVTALFNAQGTIYLGYQNGRLARVINDTVTALPGYAEASHGAVRAIHVTPSGLLFFGTEAGLFCAINNTVINIGARSGLPESVCHSIAIMSDTDLIACTDKGLYRHYFSRGKLRMQRLALSGDLTGRSLTVLKPAGGADVLWAGGYGVARLFAGSHRIQRYSGVWRWGKVSDILVRTTDHIWAATEAGFLLEVTMADSIAIRPYYYGKHYTKLLRSKSGNIWCGTDQGMSSVSAEFAAHLKVPAPYSMYEVSSMTIDRRNNMWFAASEKLYRMSIGDSADGPRLVATLSAPVTSLHADNNIVWIGTTSGLWYKAGDKSPTAVNGIPTLAGKDVTGISRGGPAGHLWVTGAGGIEELETGGSISLVKHHDKQSGLSSNDVYQAYPDSKGNIWIATDSGGVCMYDGSRYTCWDSTSGFRSKTVYSITEDARGNIWAGTPGDGLYRFDGKTWKHFGRVNGLQDGNISALMANKTGQVVIINQMGVDEWYPRSVQFRHFNTRTGPSIDSTSTTINCIAKDTAGNVYVASSKGFTVFKNVEQPLELRPSVHISKISVVLKRVQEGRHVFSYKENHMSFQYEGINFVNIERLNYRYRLEGYDDNWTFTNNEPVNFPQLAPGRYNFRLQASLDKDFEEAREVDYAFEIKAPVWEEPWFIAAAIALLTGLIYGYIKLREKALKKVAALKQERMLFEYEHLKSQVNPHFLFNSLNTLTNLIEEDQQNAIEYTVQLSALYRNILTYRNRDTILLSEECKLLQSYLYIQKRRFGNALRCESDIPQSILDTSKIVPLALQLLIENAIKHNVVTAASPLSIYIGVTDEAEIVVRNELKPKVSKEPGAGLALQNIQRRYSLLSKKPVSYGIEDNQYIVKLPLL